MQWLTGQDPNVVPALVPKPASLTVTREHLPGRKSSALRALGLPWVMQDREICPLKIRVSVVRVPEGSSLDYNWVNCPLKLPSLAVRTIMRARTQIIPGETRQYVEGTRDAYRRKPGKAIR